MHAEGGPGPHRPGAEGEGDEGDLRSRSTWLVDLEVVVELLVVGSIHVIFMEILTMLMGH